MDVQVDEDVVLTQTLLALSTKWHEMDEKSKDWISVQIIFAFCWIGMSILYNLLKS